LSFGVRQKGVAEDLGRLKGLFGEIGRLAGIFKNNAVVAGDGYLAEGSLFLGRMSQLSDGISFLLEANTKNHK
jgi:hypothetical protein